MIAGITLGVIEQALRLANNLLEGMTPQQRQAQMLAWWGLWWPVLRLLLPKDSVAAIEAVMQQSEPSA